MESPSRLRTVFFGTPEFASATLHHLVEHGESIVGVVTTPDKPQGRGRHMKGSAVKEAAEAFGIPILTPTRHREPAFLEALRAWNPDLFVVVAYKILPMEVIQIPRLGAFNVHASLLPRYRGAAPINWAIMRGESETGITTFLLDARIDTGQILLTKRCSIGPDETAGELHDVLMRLGADAALETVRGLASGSLRPTAQQDQEATTAPKIFPDDCVINFHGPAAEVHNFIRGLSPHPGAGTTLAGGSRLKILRASIPDSIPSVIPPGHYHVERDRLLVGTLPGAIEILELQREGKRPMHTKEFLMGNLGLFN